VTPTASLPMYNLPEMRVANARFWEALKSDRASEGFVNVR
jgi:hypothetical protein